MQDLSAMTVIKEKQCMCVWKRERILKGRVFHNLQELIWYLPSEILFHVG
jgi:hypothetical protein